MENKKNEHVSPERRHKYTTDEIETIKAQILESIYADIGESIVKKFLWVIGALAFAAFAWLKAKGHI